MAVLLVYCLWSLDRGLDLTDESYYLAAAIHPDAVIVSATAMHWFTSILWRLSGTLAGFRGIGLAILAGSSVVLALGAVRAFRSSGAGVVARGRSVVLIVVSTMAAALLYHAFVPFTPSYNLLAASGAYMAMGLVSLTANVPFGLRVFCLKLLVGTALGITFLAKFSAGVGAWGIVCVSAVALGGSRRERILGIGLITGSMATTIAGAVLMKFSLGEAVAQFRLGAVVYMLGANETFPGRLARYFKELWDVLEQIVTGFAVPLALFGIHAVRPRFLVAATGLAAFGYVLVTENYLLGGMDRYEQQTVPLLVSVVLGLLITARSGMRNRKAVCLFGALALLPFCVAMGTYNALHTQILFSLAPWGTLIGLLAISAPAGTTQRPSALLICALFVTTVVSQVLTNGFRAPYRLHRPLPEQTEEFALSALGAFRVDRETRNSYIKLMYLADACGIKPGWPFLGLYNIPGIALVLQSVPVGFPLLQDRLSTEVILDHLAPEAVRSAVVAINRDSGSYDPGMPKQLATFPTGYRPCGTAVLPYRNQEVELWIRPDRQ